MPDDLASRRAAPAPLFTEPFPVRDARISPDGRWVSYVSGESGHAEVSVRNLAGPARRYVVSIEGGDQPVWRRDGRELFFADLTGHLHAVSVGTGADGGLVFGSPTRLDVPPLGERHWGTTYDVSRDGQVVFFPHPGPMRPPTSFGVVTDWKALLERQRPRARRLCGLTRLTYRRSPSCVANSTICQGPLAERCEVDEEPIR